MATRMTRSSARLAAQAPVVAAPVEVAPVKRTAAKKKALANVTNTAAAVEVKTSAEPVKPVAVAAEVVVAPVAAAEPTALSMDWDVDELVSETPVATIAPAGVVVAASIAEAIPAFTPSFEHDEDDDDDSFVGPSSRRVKMLYSEAGEWIGTQDCAPIPSLPADADFYDYEAEAGDLARLGEVERMVEEEFVAPAPLEVEHAAPLHKRQVANVGYSSGYLKAGVLSASVVRSVKLDAFNDAPIQPFVFAAPASMLPNVEKTTGFVGQIDANRVASKKL